MRIGREYGSERITSRVRQFRASLPARTDVARKLDEALMDPVRQPHLMHIAITGHRELPEPTVNVVNTAVRQWLAEHAGIELIGLTCLADGADSIFAQAVLDVGGALVVIVPATEYREGLPAVHHATYDALISRAAEVVPLNHQESTSQSHMDASLYMLGRADRLIAVWDGEPARGYGGTADVVEAARQRRVPVAVIWPEGASRD